MTLSVKHKFVSAIADGADTTVVRPSNWNDTHDILMATASILGRVSAGSGTVEELTASEVKTLLSIAASDVSGLPTFGTAASQNTGTSGANVPLLNGANTWSAQQTFAAGTITTSQPLTVTQTWNAGGVTFTGLLANFTDTASASGSLLMDLKVGGVTQFSIRKDGRAYGSLFGVDNSNALFFSGGFTYLYAGGGSPFAVSSTTAIITNASSLGFAASSTPDVFLWRDAANTLALQNGTNAQTQNIYETYSGAGANFQRFSIKAGTKNRLASEVAGTGTKRIIEIDILNKGSAPAASDLDAGCWGAVFDGTNAWICYNNGGTLQKVQLT